MYNGDLRLVIQLMKTHRAFVYDAEKHLPTDRAQYLKVGIGCLDRAISILEFEQDSGCCHSCGHNMITE